MQCPRCHSERIQRDYDDTNIFLRIVGLHQLLCNNCGLVFKGFDPQGKLQRAPAGQTRHRRNRRRAPRYSVHLPSAISLIEGNTGKVSYSQPSRGHCETISKFGMALSLVGARFGEKELARPGRLLFVRVELPEGPMESVVAIVTCARAGDKGRKRWLLGVKIQQISATDTERLEAYLEKRAQGEPVFISE